MYTKGNWKIEQPKSASLSVLSADGKPIALLQLAVPPYDDKFEQACKEMLGNALLIAAAPDMYETLKDTRAKIEARSILTYHDWVNLITKIDKALAKVEGK